MTEFPSFAAASEACLSGQRVCGTYRNDIPVYFVVDANASDEEIRDIAFELKHGRPIGVERELGHLAEVLGVRA